jgi:heme A synthase
MIDAIFVPTSVHLTIGTLLLISSLLALGTTVYAAWRKAPFSGMIHFFFILFQLVLMLQVLVGIKLLDQGLGPLQLYVHYIGGCAPLAFALLFYWFPGKDDIAKSRRAAIVTAVSFLFVLMTFTIGSMYTPGGA